jgi:hypothetical protein
MAQDVDSIPTREEFINLSINTSIFNEISLE